MVAHGPEVIERGVGEHRAAGAFTHRPHAGRGGLQVVVDLHEATGVERDPRFLEADPAGIRRAPGGDQEVGALDRLFAVRRLHPQAHALARGALHGQRRGAEHDLDPLGLEDRAQRGRDLGFFAGHDLGAAPDHRHPAAEPAERLGELGADVAHADHDQVRGQAAELERLDMGERPGLGQTWNVRHGGARPEVEEQVLGDEAARAACEPRLDRPGTHDAPVGEQECDARHREQRAVGRDLGLDHGALARSYTLHVDRHRRNSYAVLRSMVHEVRDLGTVDLILAR